MTRPFDGSIQIDVRSSQQDWGASSSGPITDDLGYRVYAYGNKRDGYIDNKGGDDVWDKDRTVREAVAEAFVACRPENLALVREGRVPKGDVPAVARNMGLVLILAGTLSLAFMGFSGMARL